MPDPSIFVTSDFGLKRFTFGFGVFAPYAAPITMKYEGPQRYSVISNEGTIMLFTGIGAAYSIIKKKLRVGLTFETAIVSIKLAKSASGRHVLSDPEDKEWDLLNQVMMTSWFNPTVGIGVWGNPWKGLELGFSLQTPMSVSGTGKVNIRPLLANPNPTFDDTKQEGDKVELEFNLPMVVRLAVRYNHKNKWDVELAWVWERWGTHQRVSVVPQDVFIVDYPGIDRYRIKPLSFERNWQSTSSIRLGGSYQVLKWLRVRAGYFFEQAAAPDETVGVDMYDAPKHGLAFGATFSIKSWNFDIVYAHLFLMERNITTSTVHQINPLNEGGTTVVGNGVYNAAYNMVGVGVSYKFK